MNKKEIYIDTITGEELSKEIFTNGDIWYTNSKGQNHRIDGPATEDVYGYKAWWINGKRHRTDGPARIWLNGYKAWYQNNKRHRIGRPAVEYSDGGKEYWINDKQYTELEFNIVVRKLKMENL